MFYNCLWKWTFFIVIELAKDAEGGAFRGGAITPDGLIDEDFEKELGTPSVGLIDT